MLFFQKKGEQLFREEERELLQFIFKTISPAVVACGGGTPCFFDNMEQMNKNGLTVYLDISPAELARRLQDATRKRPLLESIEDDDLENHLKNLLQTRQVYYSQAKLRISNDHLSIDELYEKIQAMR